MLFLRALKKAGLKNERLEQRARRNIEKGYQRLLGYRSDGGGFSYWALSPPDAALTSYAIAFLEDASEFIPVEESAINDAAEWLQQQKPESFGIGSLSVSALAHQAQSSASLNELLRQVPNMDDPYAVAQFVLAAMDANRTELAPAAIARLRALARSEQSMTYWPLSANTPFHGWGRAGVIETTALAVTALSRWYKQSGGDPELKSLIDHGVLYLLRGKDESGLWLSSQATVRVLFALLEAFARVDSGQPFTAVVSVNGAPAASVPVPGGKTIQVRWCWMFHASSSRECRMRFPYPHHAKRRQPRRVSPRPGISLGPEGELPTISP